MCFSIKKHMDFFFISLHFLSHRPLGAVSPCVRRCATLLCRRAKARSRGCARHDQTTAGRALMIVIVEKLPHGRSITVATVIATLTSDQ